MRKQFLIISSCTVAIASLGLSAQALAVGDPYCEARGNPTAALGFTIDTPGSHFSRVVSDVVGSGYACGSDLGQSPGVGDSTLYKRADVAVAPGVDIADSGLVPPGTFAGTAKVHILGRFFGSPLFLDGSPSDPEGIPSEVRTDAKSECARESGRPQSDIVACLKGANPLGHNWSWAIRGGDGRFTLTVGRMYADLAGFTAGPGLTYVKLSLCGYFGSPGGAACGTSGQFQQKNGDRSDRTYPASHSQYCGRYRTGDPGIYTLTATMENDTVTAPARSCVVWRGSLMQLKGDLIGIIPPG